LLRRGANANAIDSDSVSRYIFIFSLLKWAWSHSNPFCVFVILGDICFDACCCCSATHAWRPIRARGVPSIDCASHMRTTSEPIVLHQGERISHFWEREWNVHKLTRVRVWWLWSHVRWVLYDVQDPNGMPITALALACLRLDTEAVMLLLNATLVAALQADSEAASSSESLTHVRDLKEPCVVVYLTTNWVIQSFPFFFFHVLDISQIWGDFVICHIRESTCSTSHVLFFLHGAVFSNGGAPVPWRNRLIT
jgi:hypothetical protein